MDIREFSKLIEKYKSGEISPREREILERFLESFQTNPGEWIEHEMGDQRLIGEKMYSRILRKINTDKIYSLNRTIFSPSLYQRAAAIALFFILGSGVFYLSGVFSKKTDAVVWKEEITSVGQKSDIILSDGSHVTLNAESTLRFPDRFSDTCREVSLEGEGYFIVQHAAHRPFILHTGNLSTIVLGTKFNVSAYPENKAIAVSLLEGSVQVTRSERGKNESILVLKPQEQLMYDKELDAGSRSLFDSLEVVGWKDNIYKFENEPLESVLTQLERAYGISFKITDQQMVSQKITVKFERNSLQTVVDVIKQLTGLKYKMTWNNGKQEVVFFH